ncbi:MAG: hypothetical protein K2X81_22905 [Candidatus Obscuribacterales bacterium]|nr:hypothetical protein [Candidatus Obscuribacterales bacterium]
MQNTASNQTTGQGSLSPQEKASKPAAGQWMFLQEASTATELSEKTLRRNIKKGVLKARKGKAVNAKIQVFITPDLLGKLQDPAQEDLEDDACLDNVQIEEFTVEDMSESSDEGSVQQQDFNPEKQTNAASDMEAMKAFIGELMNPLVKRVEEQAVVLQEQERKIAEQKTQLRLLPDLQTKEENERKARELAELELVALKKQIDALQKEKEELGTTAQKAAELEREIEILKAPWWKKWFSPQT